MEKEQSFEQKAQKDFAWVNLMPIACAIVVPDSLLFIAHNEPCAHLLELSNQKKPYSLKDFFEDDLCSASEKDNIFKMKTASSSSKTAIVHAKHFLNENEPFIVYTLVDTASLQQHGKTFCLNLEPEDEIDPMTGIYNEKMGHFFLEKYILGNHDVVSTICYLDIVGLGKVNEEFGRQVGDEYLLNVVSVLKSATRQTDIFSRLSCDDFLLIFPKCRYEIVETIMDTVINKLDIINKTSDNTYKTAIRFGIMELMPGITSTVSETIANLVSLAKAQE